MHGSDKKKICPKCNAPIYAEKIDFCVCGHKFNDYNNANTGVCGEGGLDALAEILGMKIKKDSQ